MEPGQEQIMIIHRSYFDLLYNNDMLNVLIRIATMRRF